jgi:UDP-3-O-[3-hydroxymyristoyl] glucosamine N-acyltransferase
VRTENDVIPTGLRKFSAVIGDHAEIGCNSVISPGSLLGRRTILYPLTHFGGVLGHDLMVKTRQTQQVVKRKGR